MIISRERGSPPGWLPVAALCCVAFAGCHKHHGTSAAASASATPSAAPAADVPTDPHAGGGESQRGQLKRSAPLLAKASKLVSSYFPGKSSAPLTYQSMPLGEGATAVVLTDPKRDPAHALLMALGSHHQVLWAHKHALGGIVPGIRHVALSTGPHGDVALFWFNEPSSTVATRLWDAGGGLLMDTQVMEVDDCQALSVFFWPAHGWVVAASRPSSFLVQLLDKNGDRDFGQLGKTIANRWRAAAPVSIAADTSSSVMLFHLGYLELSPNASSGDHLFVDRFDAHGTPLWRGPLDAGRLPARVPDDSVRVRVRTTGPGKVLASLPDDAAGGHFAVEVRSAGTAELR